jgi:outer membrane protein TolC
MKQITLIITLIVAALFPLGSAAQNSIEEVLKAIETHNKELQAHQQSIRAQKLEAKAVNNLPDPTLSYAHLWNSKDKSQTTGELILSQSFDFPSLYITRGKLIQLQANVSDRRADLFRQEKLLQAKEVCLDIILLRQQQQLLEERLNNAQELEKMYNQRLQTGDANALERNKISLELLNVKTETSLNQTLLSNKQQELTALNGNLPVTFDEKHYPTVDFPTDYEQLKREALESDRLLQTVAGESLVAHKQVTVSKSQWLPRLELGYRRDTDTGLAFNGIVVGLSFPLFSNRHKVKMAKAQVQDIDLQKENLSLKAESEWLQLYREATTLHASMEEYQRAFRSPQDLTLLKQALAGGQINMIEYFAEVSVVYQSRQNYLLLENRYQKIMAQLYKSKL